MKAHTRFLNLLIIIATLTVPVVVRADDTTFSNEDLQKVIPELANDTSILGQDLATGIAETIGKLGNPTGIIVGTEAQGAFFVGYRKG